MTEVNLPEGYSLKKEEIGGREYTFLFKGDTPVLMQPKEHVTLERIQKVIEQTKDSN